MPSSKKKNHYVQHPRDKSETEISPIMRGNPGSARHDLDPLHRNSQTIPYLNEEPNNTETDRSFNDIFSNPIKCGYLLKFSKSVNNSKNVLYVLECFHFKDVLQDTACWNENESYKIVDNTIENFAALELTTEADAVFGGGSDNEWPSTKITYNACTENTKKIWYKFLSRTSDHQIDMSAKVLSNTIYRLKYLHLYGPRVFDETLIEPIKTLKTDIIPRFVQSDYYEAMTKRLDKLYPLPTRNQLQVKPPSKLNYTKWYETNGHDRKSLTIENLRDINIYDLFHDGMIYEEFLKYARIQGTQDNILLMRFIYDFKYQLDSGDIEFIGSGGIPGEAEDLSWKIYRFYIAPGASFILTSLSDIQRKEIMIQLAQPSPDMFNSVEKLLYRQVRDLYISFTYTSEFLELPSKILLEIRNQRLQQHNEERAGRISSRWDCFGIFKSSTYKRYDYKYSPRVTVFENTIDKNSSPTLDCQVDKIIESVSDVTSIN